jgi:hypothetical protein
MAIDVENNTERIETRNFSPNRVIRHSIMMTYCCLEEPPPEITPPMEAERLWRTDSFPIPCSPLPYKAINQSIHQNNEIIKQDGLIQ